MINNKKPIRVTGAIFLRDGDVLIAQRKKDQQLALKWEFPGGKVEPGENDKECLQRELEEEFGIKTRIGDYFCTSTYKYPHVIIELVCFFAFIEAGTIRLIDHATYEWVSIRNLLEFDLAEADIPVAKRLIENA